MNTVNYNDKSGLTDNNLVGVDNNRLVVTSRPQDFGTFAVTTAENYTTIPYAKARTFRINNYTGKSVGIRRRHKKIVVDRFEDLSFANWSGPGTIESGQNLEGIRGAKINGLKYTSLTTEQMNDGSEVEVTFLTPGNSEYSIKINVWDDEGRIDAGSPAATLSVNQSNTQKNTEYRVIFRLHKTDGNSDTYLEGPNGRETISSALSGEFGTNNMQESVISIESSNGVIVDPIIYQQKVNYSHELVYGSSSVSYPCEDNISEYEVINLGSDVMNYSDTTDNISLSGFYAV